MSVPELEADDAPRYHVDQAWFEERNLSFVDIVQARMCESCLARLGEMVEDRQPRFDRKAGRMTFEVKQVAYGANPIRVIRECCARKKNFILPDMATLEAIFRVYLANGNQPMPLSHVREQLQEWCPGGGCQWLLLTDEQMERIIERDRYYGLRRHEVPAVV